MNVLENRMNTIFGRSGRQLFSPGILKYFYGGKFLGISKRKLLKCDEAYVKSAIKSKVIALGDKAVLQLDTVRQLLTFSGPLFFLIPAGLGHVSCFSKCGMPSTIRWSVPGEDNTISNGAVIVPGSFCKHPGAIFNVSCCSPPSSPVGNRQMHLCIRESTSSWFFSTQWSNPYARCPPP
jgi:hypothetical protein